MSDKTPSTKVRSGSLAALMVGTVTTYLAENFDLGMGGDLRSLISGVVVGLLTFGIGWVTREVHLPQAEPLFEDFMGLEPIAPEGGHEDDEDDEPVDPDEGTDVDGSVLAEVVTDEDES